MLLCSSYSAVSTCGPFTAIEVSGTSQYNCSLIMKCTSVHLDVWLL